MDFTSDRGLPSDGEVERVKEEFGLYRGNLQYRPSPAEIEEIVRNNSRDMLLGLATEIEQSWLKELFPERFSKSSDTLFDEQSRRVAVRHFLKFGDLELEETSGSVATVPTIEAVRPWRRVADAIYLRIDPSSEAMQLYLESDGQESICGA